MVHVARKLLTAVSDAGVERRLRVVLNGAGCGRSKWFYFLPALVKFLVCG
jgi:hypothetical protein